MCACNDLCVCVCQALTGIILFRDAVHIKKWDVHIKPTSSLTPLSHTHTPIWYLFTNSWSGQGSHIVTTPSWEKRNWNGRVPGLKCQGSSVHCGSFTADPVTSPNRSLGQHPWTWHKTTCWSPRSESVFPVFLGHASSYGWGCWFGCWLVKGQCWFSLTPKFTWHDGLENRLTFLQLFLKRPN